MPRAIDWEGLQRDTPFLAALPESLRVATRALDLPRSAPLFKRGDRPRAMYFVVSGEVRLVRPSASGGEIIIQRTHRGFIAEASMDHGSYHCDAVAAETSRLLSMPRKVFEDALSDHSFRQAWIGHLARELRRVRALAERLSLKTAQERIIHYIETEGSGGGRLVLSQSKKAWASELGLTHESLYRTLARMEHSGEIGIKGAAIIRRR